ncbi:carbon starvation protein A [Maribellus sediminis]|uniref:carbon starvation CstA family protein n=1 Tax=Maribellus sediminis TaxID=2696285 RepID=UPI00142F7961|nr:carbon starvation protein A [Maribellus sediminis]
MNSLVLAILAFIGYLVAYHTYGRYLAKKLFKLSDTRNMPANEFNDGIDFVPSKKNIIFGHHFTTIAGLGPIVGPAIGIIWGWLPAFLWVVFGAVFMGGVHDFSTMVISGRNKGKTIGDLTGDVISPGTRYVFQFIMQLLLLIVLAVFAMIVGVLFEKYPESVFPVWIEIPVAVWLGYNVRKGRSDLLYSIIAVALLYLSIYFSVYYLPPIKVPPIMGSGVVTWALILYVYAFFASTVPVQKLLQPRDYINSHQLLMAIALILLGLIVAHPVISAPALNSAAFHSENVPAMMPLLFITIACGAISGFHSLASTGTTIKQVNKESDTLFIGYGSMLTEGFLAVLVILAVAGGLGMGMEKEGVLLTGSDAFYAHYSSWASASGLAAKLEAFIIGSANLLESIGVPKEFGAAVIAVFIVSFANTTLDSAARIQRLSLQEIFKDKSGTVKKPFDNRYFATAVVVFLAMVLTFLQPGAQGALLLWPLFGALNQLVAALALGVVVLYLIMKKQNPLFALIPMLFVLIMTVWAMFDNLISFMQEKNYTLTVLSILIILLTVWLLVSGLNVLTSQQRKKIQSLV